MIHKYGWFFVAMLVALIFAVAVIAGLANVTSVEAVTNADYVANNGRKLRAVEHVIITDMDTGIQYIYFRGYGVSPLITEDGKVSKTVE